MPYALDLLCAHGAFCTHAAGRSTSPLEDMDSRASRTAVALEALLLALPVTALASFGFIAGISYLTQRHLEVYEKAQVIVYLLPMIPLLAGWALIGRFVISGPGSLRSSSNLLWSIAFLGAVIILAAMLAGYWTRQRGFGDPASLRSWVRSYLRELTLGLPAVVPLAHLTFERWVRMSSNPRLERP